MQSDKEKKHFIIGGAPRSGTTFLAELMKCHSKIYLPKILRPEPKFFINSDLYKKGSEYYEKTWFAENDTTDKIWIGEKSTNYLENMDCAELIHRMYPDMRCIFILRDPIERAISNYKWSKMNGFESGSFSESFYNEKKRISNTPDKLKISNPYAYFSRGLYSQLLIPFYNNFTAENILLINYFKLMHNPHSVFEEVSDFFHLNTEILSEHQISSLNKNESLDESIEISDSLQRDLKAMFRPCINDLARLNFTPEGWNSYE